LTTFHVFWWTVGGFAVYFFIPLRGHVGGFYLCPATPFADKIDYTGVEFPMAGNETRILVLTDFHFLGIPLGVDSRTERRIREMVNRHDPELILILGDNISTLGPNHWAQRRLIRVMDSLGIPWAPLFGNHDANGKADVEWLANRFEESENALFRWGPNNIGVPGNYFINITHAGEVVHTIFMVSSKEARIFTQNYHPYTPEQIAWYRWATEGINDMAGRDVPSSVMLHIPLPAFENVTDARVFHAGCDNGFFDTIYELGITRNIIAGHCHSNAFAYKYRGITLASVPALTGNIGMLGAPGRNRGGMVMTVSADGSTQLDIVWL